MPKSQKRRDFCRQIPFQLLVITESLTFSRGESLHAPLFIKTNCAVKQRSDLLCFCTYDTHNMSYILEEKNPLQTTLEQHFLGHFLMAHLHSKWFYLNVGASKPEKVWKNGSTNITCTNITGVISPLHWKSLTELIHVKFYPRCHI